jgi:hypothetical protein
MMKETLVQTPRWLGRFLNFQSSPVDQRKRLPGVFIGRFIQTDGDPSCSKR